MKKVTNRIIELGDRKEQVTPEDLPYIISDVLKHDGIQNKVKLLSYFVTLAQGLKPMATLSIEIDGKTYQKALPVMDSMTLSCVRCVRFIRIRWAASSRCW